MKAILGTCNFTHKRHVFSSAAISREDLINAVGSWGTFPGSYFGINREEHVQLSPGHFNFHHFQHFAIRLRGKFRSREQNQWREREREKEEEMSCGMGRKFSKVTISFADNLSIFPPRYFARVQEFRAREKTWDALSSHVQTFQMNKAPLAEETAFNFLAPVFWHSKHSESIRSRNWFAVIFTLEEVLNPLH